MVVSFSIHVIITSTKYSCCIRLNSLPGCIFVPLSNALLQHVAVACCATKTGCPFIGVCFPSFGITAGASLFAINSLACSLIVSKPFHLYNQYPSVSNENCYETLTFQVPETIDYTTLPLSSSLPSFLLFPSLYFINLITLCLLYL